MGLDGGQGRVKMLCHGPARDEPTRTFEGCGDPESRTLSAEQVLWWVVERWNVSCGARETHFPIFS